MADGGHIEGALNTPDITQTMRQLLPAVVSIAVLDPRLDQGDLMPEENQAMSRATPKRYREFTAGRVASRHAMLALGLPKLPVPISENRAPLWPDGVTGSITHCDTCCIAATAPANQIAALGIDVEICLPLPADLIETVCTASEMAWLSQQSTDLQGLLARLIFSAKESVYKCQYPFTARLIGFDAIEIGLDFDRQTFTAEFIKSVRPFNAGDRLLGRFAMAEDLILTSVTLGG